MLKAKALCAVNGKLAPEIRPLMSVGGGGSGSNS